MGGMETEVKHQIGAVDAAFFPGALPHSWLGKIGSTFFYRTSALDTLAKANLFFNEIEGAQNPLRIAILELSPLVVQWELNSRIHAAIASLGWEKGLSAQSSFLHVPIEPFYQPEDAEMPSEFLIKDFQRLTCLQNTDGWAFYCFWMAEMAEGVLEKIPLEELAVYTLEGLLKSYLHEVRTAMLHNNEAELQENSLRVAALKGQVEFPVPDGVQLVDLERQLIKGRNEARERLQIQQELLGDIARVIFQLDNPQEGLARLGRAALVLSELLKKHLNLKQFGISWGQTVSLLALLNRELGCVNTLIDEDGMGQVNLAFAIQAAWAALIEKHPFVNVVQIAQQWEETPYQKGGPLAEALRQNVLEALELFCLPMAKQAGASHKMEWHFHKQENLTFLKFLPLMGLVPNKTGQLVKAPLLVLDGKGEPIDLTPAGHFLMTKLQK